MDATKPTGWRPILLALVLLAASPDSQKPGTRGDPLASEAGSTTLTVLSYNVHGLFWPAAGGKRVRMPAIGRRVRGYDIAFLQEDFLAAHHRRLIAELPGYDVLRGNGRDGGARLLGSGLTLMFDEALGREVLRQTNVDFDDCWGRLRIASLHDCWANKGFLHARLRLAGGAEIDLVDTHLDAGGTAGDRAVRERQVDRLRRYLEREAAGRALIVAGDLNLDFGSPDQERVLGTFQSALGLHDSGARPAAGAVDERIDYILFRGGEELGLELLAAGVDDRFVEKGRPLSDHPAIYARFGIRPLPSPPYSAPSTPPDP